MKIQVRKNVLSHLWEVQKQTAPSKWEKVAEFATKEQAEKYALTAQNTKGDKLHTPKKKTAQNAKKTAKNAKAK